MTGLEAWQILSSNLDELLRLRRAIYPHMNTPYFKEELTAQVMAFNALKQMDGEEN